MQGTRPPWYLSVKVGAIFLAWVAGIAIAASAILVGLIADASATNWGEHNHIAKGDLETLQFFSSFGPILAGMMLICGIVIFMSERVTLEAEWTDRKLQEKRHEKRAARDRKKAARRAPAQQLALASSSSSSRVRAPQQQFAPVRVESYTLVHTPGRIKEVVPLAHHKVVGDLAETIRKRHGYSPTDSIILSQHLANGNHDLDPQTPLTQVVQPTLHSRVTWGPTTAILGQGAAGPVTVGSRERHAGMYVIGTSGKGKTTLLIDVALQDVANGRGICFLDPHDQAIPQLVARLPEHRLSDVLLLDPEDTEYPFALNLLACRDPSKSLAITETQARVVHIFKKLYGPDAKTPSWGWRLESILKYGVLTLLENPGYTILELPKVLTNEAFRNALLENVQNQAVHDYWDERFSQWPRADQRTHIEAVANKIDAFKTSMMTSNIVGQSDSIDFRSLMDAGKIILVSLPATLSGDTELLGTTLISQLLHSAQTRRDIRDESARRPFYIFADEFQRFATDDFATLIDEARKFAVGVTIAHQGQSQLDDISRSAAMRAAILVAMGVSGEDAKNLAQEFKAWPRPGEPRLERVVVPSVDRPDLLEAKTDRRYYSKYRTDYDTVSYYKYVPGPIREARAIEDEKAVLLRSMPAYHAYVKIATTEAITESALRSHPLPPPAGDVDERLEMIREQTRQMVCRPRSVVEDQIRQRQQLSSSARNSKRRRGSSQPPQRRRSGVEDEDQ